MAYNPNLYWPNQNYTGMNLPVSSANQPVDGLVRVKSMKIAEDWPLPPSSVSQPLMLEDDNIFFIKTTDEMGNGNLSAYRFEEIDLPRPDDKFVTKDYLDTRLGELLEAINGKHSIPTQSAEE